MGQPGFIPLSHVGKLRHGRVSKAGTPEPLSLSIP